MSNFKDYTRSTAFSMSLSKLMIELLLMKLELKKQNRSHLDLPRLSNYITTINSLERRGLVKDEFREWKNKMVRNGTSITPEGEKLCELLIMAGFEVPVYEMLSV